MPRSCPRRRQHGVSLRRSCATASLSSTEPNYTGDKVDGGKVSVRSCHIGWRSHGTACLAKKFSVKPGEEPIGPTAEQMVTIWLRLRQVGATLERIWPWHRLMPGEGARPRSGGRRPRAASPPRVSM